MSASPWRSISLSSTTRSSLAARPASSIGLSRTPGSGACSGCVLRPLVSYFALSILRIRRRDRGEEPLDPTEPPAGSAEDFPQAAANVFQILVVQGRVDWQRETPFPGALRLGEVSRVEL